MLAKAESMRALGCDVVHRDFGVLFARGWKRHSPAVACADVRKILRQRAHENGVDTRCTAQRDIVLHQLFEQILGGKQVRNVIFSHSVTLHLGVRSGVILLRDDCEGNALVASGQFLMNQ
ncbi:MAG: hypothetical protein ACPGUV_08580, partial [Polyangiales bacterium]